jgi:hypothetical protein
MPSSTQYFKNETKEYILSSYGPETRILDIGAGVGTYNTLLKDGNYTNMDCVEAWEKYITGYGLTERYRYVFHGDVTELEIDFTQYDLIILGDVLEHIERSKAQELISKMTHCDVIVAIPFESEQGVFFDNPFEIHQQADLTLINFYEKFEGFYPLCVRFDYGVFVKKNTNKIHIEIGEFPLPDHYLEFINSNYPYSELVYQGKPQVIEKKETPVTVVTALWDLGRGQISESFKRGYDNYLQKFSELLKTDIPMYIFVSKEDEEFIWNNRSRENTVVQVMSLDELTTWFGFTQQTNEIRQKESWLSQSGWLSDSPQARLEGYNPLVMSKMFMLNNVTIYNPFSSEYFFWIDAGITNTVHYGYFTHDKVFDKLPEFIKANDDFVFLTYPYIGGEEIHGFNRAGMARYSKTDYVKYVCRGGFFGGKKERINEINGLYYSYLSSSLSESLMGTEESIFTIMMHNHGDIITQFMIGEDGLVWRFFEDIKDKNFTERVIGKKLPLNTDNSALYVITFNSPKQFETLIESMIQYDRNFIDKPKKYLLDNSSDLSTTERYVELCYEFGFEHIKKDNLGICGGRQWIAEHADEQNFDFYMFFEDDMFFYPKKGEVCKNGFNRYVNNLYKNVIEIAKKNEYDFVKFNFTEFYGDNGIQWSWYNVPQNVRESHWPEKPNLPVHGTDPNAPRTKFKNIRIHNNIPYIDGEIYYCNWPQVVTKYGNKKMFLTDKWAFPYEQTWMSYMFQETIKGNIKPAMLLLTPTEHDRFDFYDGKLRKES